MGLCRAVAWSFRRNWPQSVPGRDLVHEDCSVLPSNQAVPSRAIPWDFLLPNPPTEDTYSHQHKNKTGRIEPKNTDGEGKVDF